MPSEIPEGLDEFVGSEAKSQEPIATNSNTNTANVSQLSAPAGLDEFIAPEINEEKFGSTGQQAIAGLEGIAKGAAGSLATVAERLLGVPKENILGRAEAHPVTHTAGEVVGLVGSTMAGTGLGSLLGKAGAIGAGIAESAGLGALGTNIARHAVENIVYQANDEASKLILQDPGQSADTAAIDMGLAGLIGGAFGTISPLWHATSGKLTGGILGAIADKMGGIEGVTPNAADSAIAKSGMEIAPELRGLVSENQGVQQMARELMQTDTNASGLEIQKSFKNMTDKAGNLMIEALGKSPEEIAAMPPVSKYEAGKLIGDTLANEFETQLAPLSDTFESLKGRFKDVELPIDSVDAAGQRIPGAVTKMTEDLGKLAVNEGWVSSPSSDIMKEVRRVIKELPLQKNLKNLGNFITQVGNNTNKDLMNGPLRNAGGKIISALKEAEADVIGSKLGAEAGPQALEAFKAAREGYAVQSAMKEALDSRLGIKGSTAGFSNALRDMARTDGEGVLRRLSGKGDAEALNFLSKHYPETAAVIKNYHINELLENAASKAKEGAIVDNATLLKNLDKMSPELKNFVASPEAQSNLKAIGTALEAFHNPKQNFSNTARVTAAILKDLPGTAVGAATSIAGHGFIKSALAIPLVKAIGKDIPDAIRLSLLKFLGSNEKIDAAGFKAMVEFINHTIKGENLLSRSTSNLFKAGSEVVPARLFPTDLERNKIKKALQQYKDNPDKMLDVAGRTGHYLPDHATSLTQTAANAVKYLDSQRPNTGRASPLDTQRDPTPQEKAHYNRTLDIAQQPLMVLQHISEGRLTPDDVMTQKTLYPGVYARTVQKLTDNMTNAVAKGHTVPYKVRMGLSVYMGQAMDSTMTPNGIMAAQPKQPQAQPQTAMQPASDPKRSTASLNKLPNMYQTAGQTAQKDRENRQ